MSDSSSAVTQCAWRLCTNHGLRGESSQLRYIHATRNVCVCVSVCVSACVYMCMSKVYTYNVCVCVCVCVVKFFFSTSTMMTPPNTRSI